jgi:hypothetical protein
MSELLSLTGLTSLPGTGRPTVKAEIGRWMREAASLEEEAALLASGPLPPAPPDDPDAKLACCWCGLSPPAGRRRRRGRPALTTGPDGIGTVECIDLDACMARHDEKVPAQAGALDWLRDYLMATATARRESGELAASAVIGDVMVQAVLAALAAACSAELAEPAVELAQAAPDSWAPMPAQPAPESASPPLVPAARPLRGPARVTAADQLRLTMASEARRTYRTRRRPRFPR